ncbi:MAG: SUF system NifU family Fe-S cluster assembly protein [Deltaproteobacteria bacterium RIFCSPLOWO2_12_FULL_40_28]|nr:MAG: SUF system NifU family Fe-S cluster assembly protein [Deltaproteobacteria bacterium RIFCSPHIGHO2_02_FULL_40_28]OGQ19299.1 MAG: SUF system NifU family Fe-S cluster assembly protein [Deltaproteobacteria bacterium RIFCSPHIGHO2_12_FULL_40_32]OGQ40477.1 MAG: SUF system NifU family Fe-S cluster assembly protein [Deltaproteobacteria bacterium RIFCSPLOWO2_02_FULL_40_36]OGQ53713.1 MAG: SUF system NifU family Fe-S cluster assembly protein [Deltaproteobacteria bacterium RIFCSPLOWO2_12_FULL_40_28]
MSDLEDLYQELILDHSRHPRNFGHIEKPTCEAQGYNPLCGDKINLSIKIQDGVINDVKFEGSGCAISTAAASMLTEEMKGKKINEVDPIFQAFHSLVTGSDKKTDIDLGKLASMEGVKEFPMRVKCATLSWHTLKAALEKKEEIVSTE